MIQYYMYVFTYSNMCDKAVIPAKKRFKNVQTSLPLKRFAIPWHRKATVNIIADNSLPAYKNGKTFPRVGCRQFSAFQGVLSNIPQVDDDREVGLPPP